MDKAKFSQHLPYSEENPEKTQTGKLNRPGIEPGSTRCGVILPLDDSGGLHNKLSLVKRAKTSTCNITSMCVVDTVIIFSEFE